MDAATAFNEHRPQLFGLAYRMLGSVSEAEDIVQEAYLRWEGAQHDEIDSPRAFLNTVVSRLAIDYLRSARVRRETYVGQWLPEPLVEDQRSPADSAALAESLSTALLLMLESLSPPERAAYILREAFDYSYADIAEVLKSNEAQCRQLAKRARDRITQRKQRFDTSLNDCATLTDQFLKATMQGDLEALIQTLSDDAALYSDHGGKAKAALRTIHSADKIARFLLGLRKRFWDEGTRVEQCTVNGQPGFATYIADQPDSVTSLDFHDGRIVGIYTTRNPEKLTHVPSLTDRATPEN